MILLFYLKKMALEPYRMNVEAYGQHALCCTQCNKWLDKFKAADFDVQNKECGRTPKTFETDELQALLDENDCQRQEKIAEPWMLHQSTVAKRLKSMRTILKVRKWVPPELTKKENKNQKTTLQNSAQYV